ncbi:MAG: 23S rRNA (adenine(1618)-N(6))-methyltransferase RlmF [Chitinophagales bacterium]
MKQKKKAHAKVKARLHGRNKHRERYDFKQLIASCPELAEFVKPNKYGDDSVNFFNPAAVKMLNKALLKHHYGIESWDIPAGYLCPPIPGRADYIHHIADILSVRNNGNIPTGSSIKCLDIGVGANCVYPLIGTKEYDWHFVGSEIDVVAIEAANKILENNLELKKNIEIRKQKNAKNIFHSILREGENYDLVICNPPFHASAEEAQAGTMRKLNNLKHNNKYNKPILNFGGQNNELWCEGGELTFIKKMIQESKSYAKNCLWFSSLVSKQKHIKSLEEALKMVGMRRSKVIAMGQGNKSSRILAWTFQTNNEQRKWITERWQETKILETEETKVLEVEEAKVLEVEEAKILETEEIKVLETEETKVLEVEKEDITKNTTK